MNLKTLKDIEIENKVVYLRVDYNVPIKDGKIQDDFRIVKTFPTIEKLLVSKKLIIGSHLGRPKNQNLEEFSLKPVFEYLKNAFRDGLISKKKIKLEDFKFNDLKAKITLLENLRFDVNERLDEIKCDLVVMDGFSVSHRELKLKNLGVPVIAGFLVERELNLAKKILSGVDLIIMGGKKIEDKISLVLKLIPKCNAIYFCGAISNEILNKKDSELVKKIFETATKYNKCLHFPIDGIDDDKYFIYQDGQKIYSKDIGEQSLRQLDRIILDSDSIFWNGAPGIFEEERFENGTKKLVNALIEAQKYKLVVVGGGDTANAVKKFDSRNMINNISTGGGALLTLLEGGKMPGLEEIDKI